MLETAIRDTPIFTTADPPASVVACRNVDFYFGHGETRKQILFGVSFDIRAGEVVLLNGPSGSGKTTLLTLIGALRAIPHGELTVLGHPLHAIAKSELSVVRRRIGFIFQAHNLLNFLTVRQNVELILQVHPEIHVSDRRDRTAQLLDRVGLGHRIDAYPDKLSGGQRQRVAIARALVGHPQLVLADEPTAALDSQTGREVVSLLQNLAQTERCPILMVTHDHRVLHIADRVLQMEDGRLTG